MAYKNCRNCKKKIPIDGFRTKYCSNSCQLDANNKNAMIRYHEIDRVLYKDKKEKCNCEVCDNIFNKIHPSQKICSEECRIKKREMIKDFSWFVDNKKELKGKMLNYYKLRFEIFKKDNFRCVYCGKTPEEYNIKLHLDHILPRSKGGEDVISNLRTSCSQCNLGKRDILLNKVELNNG